MKYLPYYFVFIACIIALAMMPARTVQVARPVVPVIPQAIVPPVTPKKEMPPPAEKIAAPAPVKKAVPKPPAVSVSKPVAVAVPVQPLPVPPVVSVPKVIVDNPIDLRSVVVVKCLFRNAASGAKATVYGSGAIVTADGYVVTARHVVDMAYTYAITGGKQGLVGYILDSCDIAVPPTGTKTPTSAEIRTLNPFTPVTEFAYRAQIAFVPPDSSPTGMSEAEHDFVDIALLRITSAISGELPHSFVASPVKSVELPAQGDEVVTFGFPSGIPSYGNNFYLQGSIGQVKDLVGGDQLFKNEPVGMTAAMETIGGRSGSPVFWHGFVVGVVSSKEDYSRNTTVAGIYPLTRFLEEKNIVIGR
jgi:Trypsin-like peptidase domain